MFPLQGNSVSCFQISDISVRIPEAGIIQADIGCHDGGADILKSWLTQTIADPAG
jgi:hypothetical protein